MCWEVICSVSFLPFYWSHGATLHGVGGAVQGHRSGSWDQWRPSWRLAAMVSKKTKMFLGGLEDRSPHEQVGSLFQT